MRLQGGQTYTAQTIELRSGVTLNFNGATLATAAFPGGGNPRQRFIGGNGLSNVKLIGPGKIWVSPSTTGSLDPLVGFNNCSNVEIRNLEINSQNSQPRSVWEGMHLRTNNCQDILVEDVTVLGNRDGRAADGIALGSTIRGTVRGTRNGVGGCYVDTHDDGIWARGETHNFLIENCTVTSDRSAILIGAGKGESMSNITIRNVTVRDSASAYNAAAILFKFRDSTLAENITLEGITIGPSVIRWINSQEFNRCDDGPCYPESEANQYNSVVRNFCFDNITVNSGGGNGSTIIGDGDTRVENLTFSNVQFNAGSPPYVSFVDVSGLTIANSGSAADYDFTNVSGLNITPDSSLRCPDRTGGGTPLPPTPTGAVTDTPSPTKNPTPTGTIIQGDLDKDGDVDIFDYNILVGNFGANNCGNIADIDANCKVDIFDYNIVIENFGGGGNLCGNGIVDAGEECDGTNLNNQTCTTQGFTGGTLSCISSCTFNTSQCTSSQQCTPACGSWSDAANQCGTSSCTRADCSTYTDSKTCGTTGGKGSYPLSAIWQWGGAPAWWYGQFDLVFTRPKDKSFVDAVKAVNPNVIFIPTHDFNTACDDNFISCTEEDYLHYVNGNRMSVGTATDDNATNLSKFSPLTTKIPDRVDEIVRTTGADGYGTDGLYDGAYYGYYGFPAGTDMNNDGVEDRSVGNWTDGVIQILQGIRNKIGSNGIFIYNPDNEFGLASYVNGYTHEYASWPETGTWESVTKNHWQNIASKVVSPPTFLQASSPNNGDPGRPNPDINWLRFVRAMTAQAVLLDRYMEFENTYSGKPADHLWNNYFDEFNLDFGQPTSAVQQVKSGVWARFFERGAAILVFPNNPATWPSKTTINVSDAELSGLSGYAGPYYRFLGGQDQALDEGMNNGQQFSSANFTAYQYSGWQDTMYTSGDGILLVKSPQTVVSDIIIDNDDSGTSPASTQATLSGFQQHSGCSGADDYYAVRCFTEPPFAETSGSGTATFTPNIGVAGNYKVYEWHPSISGACSSVTHVVNGQNRTVNQAADSGRWNLLGAFNFSKGTANSVVIRSPGGCTATADAVRFGYVGN